MSQKKDRVELNIGEGKLIARRGDDPDPTYVRNRRGDYEEVKALILKLRPREPCYEFHFPSYDKAKLASNIVHALSCRPRGSTSKQRLSETLPWPYRVTTSWVPNDEERTKEAGKLRVWVVERQ